MWIIATPSKQQYQKYVYIVIKWIFKVMTNYHCHLHNSVSFIEYKHFDIFRDWILDSGFRNFVVSKKSMIMNSESKQKCQKIIKHGWIVSFFSHIKQNDKVSHVIICNLKEHGGLGLLLRSDLLWNSKINELVQRKIGLISANAFVSTLGGGHFLCRQIDAAEQMALRQLEIAKLLGNLILASQCRIHLSYNLIQRGKLSSAKVLLLHEWHFAHSLEDDLLKSMVRSAWTYLHKLKRIQHLLHENHDSKTTLIHTQFHRQRFIQS